MENFFKMAAIFEVRPEYFAAELARVTAKEVERKGRIEGRVGL